MESSTAAPPALLDHFFSPTPVLVNARCPYSCMFWSMQDQRGTMYHPPDYLETSAMLISFVLLGKYLEAAVRVPPEQHVTCFQGTMTAAYQVTYRQQLD